jgi:protein transport protein SEC61 subunit beta
MRRKAAADRAEKTANLRPSSTRAAGAGGSSSTMLSKWIQYPGDTRES